MSQGLKRKSQRTPIKMKFPGELNKERSAKSRGEKFFTPTLELLITNSDLTGRCSSEILGMVHALHHCR